ncbi:MAG: hypothetical protein V1787_05385 [Candidatus Micrarchaeota archaeon]
MKRPRRLLRRKGREKAPKWKAAGEAFSRHRRRSHPISAVGPFLAFVLLLVAALFALHSSGLKLSPLSLMFIAILLMLIGLGIFMAYSLHARESEEDFESYRGELAASHVVSPPRRSAATRRK